MAMGNLGDQAATLTNKQLADEELKLLAETTVDLESLRPQVGDTEEYTKLIAVVNEATDNNESLAQLQTRLKTLGANGIALAKKVAGIVKTL